VRASCTSFNQVYSFPSSVPFVLALASVCGHLSQLRNEFVRRHRFGEHFKLARFHESGSIRAARHQQNMCSGWKNLNAASKTYAVQIRENYLDHGNIWLLQVYCAQRMLCAVACESLKAVVLQHKDETVGDDSIVVHDEHCWQPVAFGHWSSLR
jgi:hypothetical protein